MWFQSDQLWSLAQHRPASLHYRITMHRVPPSRRLQAACDPVTRGDKLATRSGGWNGCCRSSAPLSMCHPIPILFLPTLPTHSHPTFLPNSGCYFFDSLSWWRVRVSDWKVSGKGEWESWVSRQKGVNEAALGEIKWMSRSLGSLIQTNTLPSADRVILRKRLGSFSFRNLPS